MLLKIGLIAALLTTPAETPVADAAEHNDAQSVRYLLQHGEDVNAAQGDGMTALHWAAEYGDEEMAGMLIYAGAKLEPHCAVSIIWEALTRKKVPLST